MPAIKLPADSTGSFSVPDPWRLGFLHMLTRLVGRNCTYKPLAQLPRPSSFCFLTLLALTPDAGGKRCQALLHYRVRPFLPGVNQMPPPGLRAMTVCLRDCQNLVTPAPVPVGDGEMI